MKINKQNYLKKIDLFLNDKNLKMTDYYEAISLVIRNDNLFYFKKIFSDTRYSSDSEIKNKADLSLAMENESFDILLFLIKNIKLNDKTKNIINNNTIKLIKNNQIEILKILYENLNLKYNFNTIYRQVKFGDFFLDSKNKETLSYILDNDNFNIDNLFKSNILIHIFEENKNITMINMLLEDNSFYQYLEENKKALLQDINKLRNISNIINKF